MMLISPPAAVFEIAPANVLHGAVRLHGLTSSPTPEIQVRVACAEAAGARNTQLPSATAAAKPRRALDDIITASLCIHGIINGAFISQSAVTTKENEQE